LKKEGDYQLKIKEFLNLTKDIWNKSYTMGQLVSVKIIGTTHVEMAFKRLKYSSFANKILVHYANLL